MGSRVGLRVFALFLVAAVLPVALLVLLTQRSVDSAMAGTEMAAVANTAKSAAIVTLDRLRVAQVQLHLHAATHEGTARGPTHTPSVSALSATRRFATTNLDAEDLSLAGMDASTLRHVLAGLNAASVKDTLAIVPHQAGGRARVVLAHPDKVHGAVWVGVVDPEFLWDGTGELRAGLWTCALAGSGEALFCSDPAREADAVPLSGGNASDEITGPSAAKTLFLAGHFNAEPWTFVSAAAEPVSGEAGLDAGLAQTALAVLLVAALASMVQIRRTLVPLARLAEGARRIGQRHFDTRIDVHGKDEFAALALAMNDMSGQVQAQFDELAALSAIDRAIISEPDVDAVLRRVARQLVLLCPAQAVVVARTALDEPGRFDCQVLAAGASSPRARTVHLPALECDALAAAPAGLWPSPDATPGWAAPLAELGARHGLCLPILWRGELRGFLALGDRAPVELQPDAERRLEELRDRVAVAVTTAQREQRLVFRARHDSLTGLLNRHGLGSTLDVLAERARTRGTSFAVLFIDLDRFKTVNDTLGHQAGDLALKIAAERVTACIDTTKDAAARPSGDEFVVVLDDIVAPARAIETARTLSQRLRAPLSVRGTAFALGASVGVAIFPDHGSSGEELLRNADMAMYESKRLGQGQPIVFEGRYDVEAQRRGWIDRDLRFAVERDELRLLYQPRVSVATGRIQSVEALIRWQHPQHGLCMPGDFVPIAEESDLIETIGDWVIDTACAQARAWADAGQGELRVAVNVSARQLRSPHLEATLRDAIDRHGVRPQALEIEITEGLFVDHDPALLQRLERIRSSGISVALDDFGTGYSSMSYLRRLPLDIMKIDRAFVIDLGTEASALAVVRAIVTLATTLGKRLVAEGVETTRQAELLRELGCDELQGYLFGRPQPAAAISALLLPGREAATEDCALAL